MNTPSSALSDEMKGAMSTLLNAVIFEQWLRFSWIEEDEEGDFCIQIPAETIERAVCAVLEKGGSDVPAFLFWAAGKSQAALAWSGPGLENMAGGPVSAR